MHTQKATLAKRVSATSSFGQIVFNSCLNESGSTQCTFYEYSLHHRTLCLSREFQITGSKKTLFEGKERKEGWVNIAGEATWDGPEAFTKMPTGILQIWGERWWHWHWFRIWYWYLKTQTKTQIDADWYSANLRRKVTLSLTWHQSNKLYSSAPGPDAVGWLDDGGIGLGFDIDILLRQTQTQTQTDAAGR